MRPEPSRADAVVAIHATAVAIGGHALLIRGPSRSGKSRLAVALIGASTSHRRIELIGDDRILVWRSAAGWVACSHPRIAGFIERRGLGIVAIRHRALAPIAGIVALGRVDDDLLGENFPVLSIVSSGSTPERRDMVLAWWNRGKIATSAQHSGDKPRFLRASGRKD